MAVADVAARSALVFALAALLAVLVVQVVWPSITSTVGVGPCGRNPTVDCFRAHPDYYQEMSPGSGGYSTPISRFNNDVLTPILMAAWPLTLASAVIGAIALVIGTTRRREAIAGMAIASVTVVWMIAAYLAFLVFGGGE